MQALSGERLLAAWDRAQGEHALLRPVTLLAAAMPECHRAQLLDMPITERDRLLLQLRELSFGPVMDGFAICMHCGSAMEFSISVATALGSLDEKHMPTSIDWMEGGEPLHLRTATTADLLASVQMPTAALAEERLLSRCLGLDDVSADAAKYFQRSAMHEHFEQLHAASELRCALACPQCAHEETWDLDVAHFVCLDARHAAHQLLEDVHALALHYGWSEAAIAGMSPRRRNAYLELLSI